MDEKPRVSMVESRVKKATDLTQLGDHLSEMIGPGNVVTSPDLEIDEFRPGLLIKPGNHGEVLESLRMCSEAGAAVVPAGLMSWLECGNPLRRADVVLSLTRMNRLVEYSPADLTTTVEAGMTIGDFNSITNQDRQWLPLDPPGAQSASLGAIAACASSGPLRLGFGKPRDYVIGLRLAHIDGTESKSGGRVVKNVAGYDMNKLYVGSWGTLAIITELTFKLRPVPERQVTVAAFSDRVEALVEAGRAIMDSDLQPVSLYVSAGPVSKHTADGPALLVRFVDCEEAVDYQLQRLKELLPSVSTRNVEEADAIWSDVANIDRRARHTVRVSVPLSGLESLMRKASALVRYCAMTGDLGTGELRITFDGGDGRAVDVLNELRSEAQRAGGWFLVERAPLEIRRRVDAWSDPGAAAEIMRSIKSAFDPRGLLSPGRFVSGI